MSFHHKRRVWVQTEQRADGWHVSCGDEGGEFARVHGPALAGVDAALKAMVPYIACLATENDPFPELLR